VTANCGASTVSVFVNSGSGSFRPRIDFWTGPNPYAVAIGDVNGNGKADVVTADASAGLASVLISK
jgi:FG-GAP-like repeat